MYIVISQIDFDNTCMSQPQECQLSNVDILVGGWEGTLACVCAWGWGWAAHLQKNSASL